MADELKGKRIAFLATEGVEQVELEQPLAAVREAGADAELVSLDSGPVQGFNHLDKADTFPSTRRSPTRARGLRRPRAARRREPRPTARRRGRRRLHARVL